MTKTVIVIGLAIVALGVAMLLGVPFGRLPGDIVIRRGPVTFAFPVTTCVLISVVLTLLLTWLRR
jgi:predicted MFS family arabinose efflux permease